MAQLPSIHRLKVGVYLPQEHMTYETYAETVRQADALGCDSIWNWDHFSPQTQGSGEAQGNHFESLTLLSAMAAITQRVQLGCLVICNSYRNPALLASMAKTIDHVSHGRFILGIGAGWHEEEYQEYGYVFEPASRRLAALEEAIKIIQKHWVIDKTVPPRHPIPILIGGEGEKVTLRLAAQYATMWHSFGDPDCDPTTYAHKVHVLEEWCAKVGRNPAEIECVATPNSKQFTASILDAYREAGATHIAVSKNTPWDVEEIKWLVEWRDTRLGAKS